MVSFIMSQFFGLYMVIIAIIMLGRAKAYRQLVQKMDPQSGTVLLAGLIGLFLGMCFVGLHNVWVWAPIIYITLLSWMILILSLLWLVSPERMVLHTRKLFLSSGYYIVISAMLVSGLVLLFRGIYMYVTHKDAFLLSFAWN